MKWLRLMILKKKWDLGYSVTSPVKYIAVMAGISNLFNNKLLFIIFVLYMLSCFIIGHFYMRWGFFEAENEVSNLYNLFQKEVRQRLKIKKKR